MDVKAPQCKVARRVPRAVPQVDGLPPDPVIRAQSGLGGHFSTSTPILKISIPAPNLGELLNSFSPNIIFPRRYRSSPSLGSTPGSKTSLCLENVSAQFFAKYHFLKNQKHLTLELRSEAGTHPNRFFEFTLVGERSIERFPPIVF